MTRIRRATALLAMAAATGASMLLGTASAGAAELAPAPAAATAACNFWNVGEPYVLYSRTAYAVSNICSNYPAGYESYLQRKTTFGWKTLDSVKTRVVAGRLFQPKLESGCDGAGTQTYRQMSRAQNAAGQWQTKYSVEKRLSC